MRFRIVGAALAALILAACATSRPSPPGPVVGPTPPVARPATPSSNRLELSRLPHWGQDDHAAAFAAFQSTCAAARDPALSGVCRRAKGLGRLDAAQAKAFFEDNFQAQAIGGPGVLTAYFAPEYPARMSRSAEFSAPVRAKPLDMVTVDGGLFDPAQSGKPAIARADGAGFVPYPDRAEIERQPYDNRILAWMRPEELFFLQIQGSGVLDFPDGRRMKAVYAANNGKPFVGVANPMRQQGLLAPDNTSGEAIRNWLAAHRGAEADAVMRLNPRYVFFSLAPDDGRQPAGAAGVPLPPGRAIAVDASRHSLGQLFWIDAEAPSLRGAFPAYRRLAVALDVGGAIKGDVRADLYIGQGLDAGAEAGRVRHELRMYRLVPRDGQRS